MLLHFGASLFGVGFGLAIITAFLSDNPVLGISLSLILIGLVIMLSSLCLQDERSDSQNEERKHV